MKIFKEDIQNGFNKDFSDIVYWSTNRTVDPDTPCNLTDSDNMIHCPLADPFKLLTNGFNDSSVCVCQNLMDYQEMTNNPLIRDDYISTRFYAMTFAPNKTTGPPLVLKNSSELAYMPSYEPSKPKKVLQMFMSEDFLNSVVDSFTDEGK